jgi:hypothetical protein
MFVVLLPKMFVCTNVDPDAEDQEQDWYLKADMQISCDSTYYKAGRLYAVSLRDMHVECLRLFLIELCASCAL